MKIWLSNQRNTKKKSIISKYAKFSHMSKHKANKEAFLLPFIIDKQMQEKLDLDEKERTYLEDKKFEIITEKRLKN